MTGGERDAETDLERGRYRAFYAQSDAQVAQSQTLRATCFGLATKRDIDPFDAQYSHILISDRCADDLVASVRVMNIRAADVMAGYAAQFYDLSALAARGGQLLEMGRFCIDPTRGDPDIPRLMWAALTRHVDRHAIRLLFGCTSFPGTDPAPYRDVFALLGARHLAPASVAPGCTAAQAHRFSTAAIDAPTQRRALSVMPQLLRFYLAMGATVGHHAVPDADMNTLHVFTALDVDAVSPARQRLLRAI